MYFLLSFPCGMLRKGKGGCCWWKVWLLIRNIALSVLCRNVIVSKRGVSAYNRVFVFVGDFPQNRIFVPPFKRHLGLLTGVRRQDLPVRKADWCPNALMGRLWKCVSSCFLCAPKWRQKALPAVRGRWKIADFIVPQQRKAIIAMPP